ncbi:MAG: glycosyl transferase group 2 family protein [Fusobacteria bacterium]|nr:MAG: glycosyl transferase group 2 family protein [Fusobacteriota bacterium]KAF0229201.1 MAG: glycosyl transferase group 2 family [Fusobacteriota bacterium]
MLVIIYSTLIFGILATLMFFFKLPKIGMVMKEAMENRSGVTYLSVSIIIPARNEESNLPHILSDLMKQTYPIHEIICVDDGSKDRTLDIIKKYSELGLVKVKGIGVENLPKGWKGKAWACQSGAKAADGELVLFIDSDVRFSEKAVELLVESYLRKGKPISVQPYHSMKKQYEYLSLFFNLIEVCGTGLSILGNRVTQGFFGPVLLIEKRVFSKFGGYERVKNRVIEDFDLGKYLGRNGVSIELFLGGKDIRFRMYSKSIKEVIEGWSKNFASGSFAMNRWLFIAIVWWIGYLILLPTLLIRGILLSSDQDILILGGLYIFSVMLLFRGARSVGSYPFFICLVYPIYLLVFQFIYFYSIIGTYLLKTTTWKGRKL